MCSKYAKRGLKNLKKYAQWYQSTSPEIQVPSIQPGDEVLVKVFLGKSQLEPKWDRPYTVILCSYFGDELYLYILGKAVYV